MALLPQGSSWWGFIRASTNEAHPTNRRMELEEEEGEPTTSLYEINTSLPWKTGSTMLFVKG
jgi:hypothetical protein